MTDSSNKEEKNDHRSAITGRCLGVDRAARLPPHDTHPPLRGHRSWRSPSNVNNKAAQKKTMAYWLMRDGSVSTRAMEQEKHKSATAPHVTATSSGKPSPAELKRIFFLPHARSRRK
ncbi:hypothetical protein H7347_09965 [Corynebacterium sp. zg-331]|uniref:hypothetical protein n=1 Tax=unclassified Corynebacterium TaxID=2624378 RepID=UPI00128D5EF3|nr:MULTISPECIES: hypothetical protein [unclassified Corynebacterium]MBC3186885.1 hypothetical protein [Corynebacterium sp. zg-331]MPV53365.1 hypothetical protein [Corynebacterium sp. zg331]